MLTAATTEGQPGYECWSILELMGHRRLGGFVREVQLGGAGFLRIDVPGDADGETHSTQFYPPSSVYCLTPVSEEAARIVARSSRPEPLTYYEIPRPKLQPARGSRCRTCGLLWEAVCGHCGGTHPCECTEAEDAEVRDSRRGEDGKTDMDDF